jgi:hypothetical protein
MEGIDMFLLLRVVIVLLLDEWFTPRQAAKMHCHGNS